MSDIPPGVLEYQGACPTLGYSISLEQLGTALQIILDEMKSVICCFPRVQRRKNNTAEIVAYFVQMMFKL